MYALEQLQQKSLNELKEIGWQLKVLPEGDRRRRQSWIDAIAGVNPPLLQLLEASPGVEVDRVEKPFIEAIKTSPAAEAEQAQEPLVEPVENLPGVEVDPVKVRNLDYLNCPRCRTVGGLYSVCPGLDGISLWETRCTHCDYVGYCIRHPFEDVRPFEVDRPRSRPKIPGVEVHQSQEPIIETVETSPGVELIDDELPECSNCFGDGYTEDEFGVVKFSQCEYEPRLSRQTNQCAIAPAANISNSDLNPILTGVALSDRFLARYAPPQSETLHYDTDGYKVDTDGQLSLFNVHVQSPPEPPDPDDFESLDEFREAITRWDWEHPSNFDHCSDHLPSSLHCEPPNPEDFDSMFAFWAAYDAWDKATDDNSEPLEISLDSFCEWAPCPEDWYEPHTLLEPSKVSELSPACKSSITSGFFIPTFGSLGDRFNRSDEPPDTGVFARLPKPKPPNFPPQASQPKSVRHPETIPKLSRNYPETIWATPQLIRSGANQQPARSPPGGDA